MPDNPIPQSTQSFYDPVQNAQLLLINQKLDTINNLIERNHKENVSRLDDHEARLRNIENVRLPEIEKDYENLSARVNLFGFIQAGYATIGSVIAAFLGRMQ